MQLDNVAKQMVKASISLSTPIAARTAAQSVMEAAGASEIPAVVEKAVKKNMTQSPIHKSKRVASTLFSVLSLVLVEPNVQAALTSIVGAFVPAAWLPMATILLAGLFAALDKYNDLRPVR